MAHQLKSVLSGNPELLPLLSKANELNILQRHYIGVAPRYLAQSSQVLSLQMGTLNIGAANATIAAKLRQLAPQLAALLQAKGCEISGIRVKVQVSYNRSNPKSEPRKLGNMAQNALNKLRQSLPDDSTLKLSLEKLIKVSDAPHSQ